MVELHHVLRWSAAGFVMLAAGCTGDPVIPEPPPGDLNVTLTLETVASGLDNPLDLTTPAGDTRLFVANQNGVVNVINGGQVLGTPYLNLSGDVSTGGEQGLLGIAFHPNYAANGFFYASYTDNNGDSRIDRFTVSADPNVAGVNTRLNIITIPQPNTNHNGGQIAFGSDGMLYYSVGDGGGSNDPDNSGQDLTTLLGAMLRLDVDGGTPYAIPSDNPFAGSPTAREEIWAQGLRNPWRFSFDRTSGNIYIGDVGQNALEEVNVESATAAGLNYGWNVMEGTRCRPGGNQNCDQTGLTLPAIEYPNPSQGCAVTGGYVYRGSAIPEIVGHYFYSDFCGGWLRSFRYENGSVSDETEWSVGQFGNPRSFGEDADGELYILSGSAVRRIVPVTN